MVNHFDINWYWSCKCACHYCSAANFLGYQPVIQVFTVVFLCFNAGWGIDINHQHLFF